MSLTDEPIIEYERNGDWVGELTTTPTGLNNPSRAKRWREYRRLKILSTDGKVANDGTDTETVTVEVVDGLEIARGTDPAEATVLDYDGDVTLSIDGQQTTKTLTNGSFEFDIITDKTAGAKIKIVAESMADHPAESDSATIEVVSQ